MKKVDFLAFFPVFRYICSLFGRIYRFDYKDKMRKNFFYIFPQKKIEEKNFFSEKNFFFNPTFRTFRHLSIFNAE